MNITKAGGRRIFEAAGKHLRLKGTFEFAAQHAKEGEIQDSFALEIIVPGAFPKSLPRVTETGGRIPRTGEYHVNSTDSTLCLGSPLSLLLKLSKKPTIDASAHFPHLKLPKSFCCNDC